METFLIVLCVVAGASIVTLAGVYFYWAATAIVQKVKGEGTDLDQDPTPFMAGLSYLFWAGLASLTCYGYGDINPENQMAAAIALIGSLVLAVVLVIMITKQCVKLVARGAHFAHWWKITPCHLWSRIRARPTEATWLCRAVSVFPTKICARLYLWKKHLNTKLPRTCPN